MRSPPSVRRSARPLAARLGLTGTSGPGLALKSESLGLAVMVELPIVVAMIQRSGPSTGMPTKTEQADLLQAMFGRNGECPVAIVAPATPAECFDMAIEAFRIALRHMVPTIFLSDGYLGTSSEPWRLPSLADLPKIEVDFATDPETFRPYSRDPETLARPWAVPGTPGLEHRIGGLEKADITGNVSYDAENHDRMVALPGREGRAHRQRHPGPEGRLESRRDPCSCSAGAARTARLSPPSSGHRRAACLSPTPISAT